MEQTKLHILSVMEEISRDIIEKKRKVEDYAASIGLDVVILGQLDRTFRNQVYEKLPILQYVLLLKRSTSGYKPMFSLDNINVDDDIAFAVKNYKLCFINEMYNYIDKINEKKKNIKFKYYTQAFRYLIKFLNIDKNDWTLEVQKNGKEIFTFEKDEDFNAIMEYVNFTNKQTEEVLARITDDVKKQYSYSIVISSVFNTMGYSMEQFNEIYPYVNRHLMFSKLETKENNKKKKGK